MSWLPQLCGSAEKIKAIFNLFGDLPVTDDKVAKALLKDPDIAIVLTAVQHGSWSHLLDKPTLLPYHKVTD